MKYLITGISGFVGGHCLEYILTRYPKANIIGIDSRKLKRSFLKGPSRKNIKFYKISLLDKRQVSALIKQHKPNYIIHLASYSSVAYSWENPDKYLKNNVGIAENMLEAVKTLKKKPRILLVGSSEEYGLVEKKALPAKEEWPLCPASPYAISRVMQEELAKTYADLYNIPIIYTRSFNHIGPRQRATFAVGSFARQVARAKKGSQKKIVCGNLNVIRDFLDVRDVVRAYDLLLRKGRPGEVYNVCSGKGYKLSEILNMLKRESGTKIKVKIDTRLLRPADNPIMIGSPKKLKKHTGFQREYTLTRSLRDMLNYWEPIS